MKTDEDIEEVEVWVPPPDLLPDPAPSSPLEALEWLGGTVEEVVEGLRARGIKGNRFDPKSCPLASYLCAWWPNTRFAEGYADMYQGPRNEDHIYSVAAPLACWVFEYAFDAGEFPDLVAD